MRTVHTITISSETEKRAFREAGVELPQPNELVSAVSFDIEEDDPHWKQVAKLVKQFHALDLASTKFSKKELNGARFLRMIPSWHHGYPQPEENFGYLKATYDLSSYCEICGTGAKQNAPFRIKKPPNWGGRSILQLNWVFDEYFVKPDVWKTAFKPFGIACRPVLLHKSGVEIESVVQLDNSAVTDLQMNDRRYEFEECSKCGKRKYAPRITGFFPGPLPTNAALFRSRQYFGSGAIAFNAVLVSNALYQMVEKTDVKGVEFHACADARDFASDVSDVSRVSMSSLPSDTFDPGGKLTL